MLSFWSKYIGGNDTVRWDRFEEGVVTYVRNLVKEKPQFISLKNIHFLLFGLQRSLNKKNEYFVDVYYELLYQDDLLYVSGLI